MWDDSQLNNAKYVVYKEQGSNQELNVGTIEITTGSTQGIYLMHPVPPFGGLGTDDNSVAGMKTGACVPQKNLSVAYVPRGIPVPDRQPPDQYVIHDFGKCNL